ncbi:hypothetical protein ACFQNE_03115 [Gordonia phosphorivorans]|uniref:Uncharacterized protein n=1 Tax=Gordonia phosphorivorans TaxID=1056982 RepID=A0ABV6H4P8_9ACTN
MTTFDYPTPEWAAGRATAVIDIETIGAVGSTLSNVIASLMAARMQSLPPRSADATEASLWELMFLQQYPFVHMVLMTQEQRAEVALEGVEPWYVVAHSQWLREAAEVFENTIYQVEVRGLPFPAGFQTRDRWLNHLDYFAQSIVRMADYIDSNVVDEDAS